MSETQAHAVRRRLIMAANRHYIERMLARGIPRAVTQDALVLANGDTAVVDAALDHVGFPHGGSDNRHACIRLHEHLRRTTGRQL